MTFTKKESSQYALLGCMKDLKLPWKKANKELQSVAKINGVTEDEGVEWPEKMKLWRQDGFMWANDKDFQEEYKVINGHYPIYQDSE